MCTPLFHAVSPSLSSHQRVTIVCCLSVDSADLLPCSQFILSLSQKNLRSLHSFFLTSSKILLDICASCPKFSPIHLIDSLSLLQYPFQCVTMAEPKDVTHKTVWLIFNLQYYTNIVWFCSMQQLYGKYNL